MKIKYIGFLLAIFVLSFMAAGDAHALFGFGKYTSVEARDGVVTIPASDVDDGKAHYFSFDVNGTAVKFFLVQSSDGVIRAAFDACDVCYREKKGYSQNKDFMVCNNCNMAFHTSRINEVQGGCNPSPLARENDGTNVIIKASDIVAGRRYF